MPHIYGKILPFVRWENDSDGFLSGESVSNLDCDNLVKECEYLPRPLEPIKNQDYNYDNDDHHKTNHVINDIDYITTNKGRPSKPIHLEDYKDDPHDVIPEVKFDHWQGAIISIIQRSNKW